MSIEIIFRFIWWVNTTNREFFGLRGCWLTKPSRKCLSAPLTATTRGASPTSVGMAPPGAGCAMASLLSKKRLEIITNKLAIKISHSHLVMQFVNFYFFFIIFYLFFLFFFILFFFFLHYYSHHWWLTYLINNSGRLSSEDSNFWTGEPKFPLIITPNFRKCSARTCFCLENNMLLLLFDFNCLLQQTVLLLSKYLNTMSNLKFYFKTFLFIVKVDFF